MHIDFEINSLSIKISKFNENVIYICNEDSAKVTQQFSDIHETVVIYETSMVSVNLIHQGEWEYALQPQRKTGITNSLREMAISTDNI